MYNMTKYFMQPTNRVKIIVLTALTIVVVVAIVFFVPKVASFNKVNQGETDAKKTLTKVDPTLSNFEKGQFYFNHGDQADGTYDINLAKFYYKLAVAEEEPNPLAWYQLGRIYFILGETENALEAFAKQQELFGDNPPNIFYMLGLVYGFEAKQSGEAEYWQLAAENFAKFLEYRPGNPWGRVDLSWIYFSQGRFEDMLPVLAEGLYDNPDNPWLLNMYGLALLNTGYQKQAHLYFKKALEEAEKLTPGDWGKSYPGNDPEYWADGLDSFRQAISDNIKLTTD